MHEAGSAGTRSDLEDRFMALVRGAKLPEPIVNTHVRGIEADFRWGDFCVEIDGPGICGRRRAPRTRPSRRGSRAMASRSCGSPRRRSIANRARSYESSRRISLPDAVRGSESTTVIDFGTLKRASFVAA